MMGLNCKGHNHGKWMKIKRGLERERHGNEEEAKDWEWWGAHETFPRKGKRISTLDFFFQPHPLRPIIYMPLCSLFFLYYYIYMVPLFIVTNNYSAFVFRHSITSGIFILSLSASDRFPSLFRFYYWVYLFFFLHFWNSPTFFVCSLWFLAFGVWFLNAISGAPFSFLIFLLFWGFSFQKVKKKIKLAGKNFVVLFWVFALLVDLISLFVYLVLLFILFYCSDYHTVNYMHIYF